MTRIYTTPCPCTKDCSDRQSGCHSKCEKYSAWVGASYDDGANYICTPAHQQAIKAKRGRRQRRGPNN